MQMMLHLEGLNCLCHLCCQVSSLLRSSWRLSQSESSTTTLYKRVSLANSLTVEVRLFDRSLMYVRNNSRLRRVTFLKNSHRLGQTMVYGLIDLL